MVRSEARLMADMADYYDERTEDFTPDDVGMNPGSRRTYSFDEVKANNAAARRRQVMKPSRSELLKAKANAEALLGQLEEQIQEIDEALEVAYPAEPGPNHDRFSVLVQFGGPRSKKYEFLLLRSGGKWFTTGTGNDTKVFESWTALLDWLDGPDVRWHSDLQRLKVDMTAWDLRRGELVFNDKGEAPF
jgi:hypothetical protein